MDRAVSPVRTGRPLTTVLTIIRICNQICSMYVCICNAVTERTIREAAASGVRTLAELSRRTGCSDCCGTCSDLAQQILEDTHRTRTLDLPLIAIAA